MSKTHTLTFMRVIQCLLLGKLLHVQISRMFKIKCYMNIHALSNFNQIRKTFAAQIVDFNQIHF